MGTAVDGRLMSGFDGSDRSVLVGRRPVARAVGAATGRVAVWADEPGAPSTAYAGDDARTPAKAVLVADLGYLGAMAAVYAVISPSGTVTGHGHGGRRRRHPWGPPRRRDIADARPAPWRICPSTVGLRGAPVVGSDGRPRSRDTCVPYLEAPGGARGSRSRGRTHGPNLLDGVTPGMKFLDRSGDTARQKS